MHGRVYKLNTIKSSNKKNHFCINIIVLFDTVLFDGITPDPIVTVTGPEGTISTCVEINIFVSKIENDRRRGLKSL